MTPLSHEEVEELLGAYALGALPEDERRRVEEHLAGCDQHRAAATELGQVTAMLALVAPEREPSPELKGRIIAAVATKPQVPQASRPAQSDSRQRFFERWRPASRIALFAAAALVLLVAGFGIGRWTAPPPAGQQLVAWTFTGNARAPGAVAHVVYFTSEHRAVMEVTGLQALTPGQVYELWLFRGATPIPAGVGNLTSGTLLAQLDSDLSQYQQIAITIEPGEQQKPTTSPILVGVLTR
jgi:anti-sigma-K factor RskA